MAQRLAGRRHRRLGETQSTSKCQGALKADTFCCCVPACVSVWVARLNDRRCFPAFYPGSLSSSHSQSLCVSIHSSTCIKVLLVGGSTDTFSSLLFSCVVLCSGKEADERSCRAEGSHRALPRSAAWCKFVFELSVSDKCCFVFCFLTFQPFFCRFIIKITATIFFSNPLIYQAVDWQRLFWKKKKINLTSPTFLCQVGRTKKENLNIIHFTTLFWQENWASHPARADNIFLFFLPLSADAVSLLLKSDFNFSYKASDSRTVLHSRVPKWLCCSYSCH